MPLTVVEPVMFKVPLLTIELPFTVTASITAPPAVVTLSVAPDAIVNVIPAVRVNLATVKGPPVVIVGEPVEMITWSDAIGTALPDQLVAVFQSPEAPPVQVICAESAFERKKRHKPTKKVVKLPGLVVC